SGDDICSKIERAGGPIIDVEPAISPQDRVRDGDSALEIVHATANTGRAVPGERTLPYGQRAEDVVDGPAVPREGRIHGECAVHEGTGAVVPERAGFVGGIS